MNDLLERYLGAVCVYFFGNKKKKVYDDLKKTIQSLTSQYDDMENVLIKFGHPKSVAISYGYRPFIDHIFNKKSVYNTQKNIFIIAGIYLLFSTLYYLYQFNCLPFVNHTVTTLNESSIITWTLNNPFLIMMTIFILNFIILIIEERKSPVNQDIALKWTIDDLNHLPHQSQYPNRLIETYLILIFISYFLIYEIIFSTPMINEVQHTSYQMIHLMRYFFHPFILIVILDYGIDISKKVYSKQYLLSSSVINLFIFTALTIFIVNSTFLKDYLLPFTMNFQYLFINILIIFALLVIYFVVLFKLLRNIKYYRSLYIK